MTPTELCGLCRRRCSDTVPVSNVNILSACSACRDRLSAWISTTTREARTSIWVEGARIADAARETNEETGEVRPIWEDFRRSMEATIIGASPLVEAGARIDLGNSLLALGMIDEAVCEFGQAMQLTTEPSVLTQALNLLLAPNLVRSYDDLRSALFPS